MQEEEDGMAEKTGVPSRSSPYLFPAKIDSSLSHSANHMHDAPMLDPCEIYTRPAEAELTEMSASQQSRSIDSVRFRYMMLVLSTSSHQP
jgi:hypothetical protein